MLIEAPRFTRKDLLNFLLIIKDKQKDVVTHVMDFESIHSPPQRTKSPNNNFYIQGSFCQELCRDKEFRCTLFFGHTYLTTLPIVQQHITPVFSKRLHNKTNNNSQRQKIQTTTEKNTKTTCVLNT